MSRHNGKKSQYDYLLPPVATSDPGSDGEEELLIAPEAHANWLTAGQLMVADIVGVGVLSLPSAMAQLGWIMGPIFIILFFPLNYYTGILLWRVRLLRRDAITYMDMGRAMSGDGLAKFAAVVVYLHIWLTLGDYLLVLGESLELLFYDVDLCKREFIFIGAVCVLPLCQLRSLNDTKWLCWLNMFTITATIATALGYLIWLGTDQTLLPGGETESVPASLTIWTFSTAFSKIAFAYAGQFLYLEIMAEMSEPQDFPKSFILAGPYQVGMYLISACVGYAYKGQNAQGLMVNFIPRNGWLRLAAAFLFIHMIVTYLIKASVLSRALHRAVSPKHVNDKNFRGKLEWFLSTVTVMISCILIANTIPFFDPLTGLIGASFVPIACWNLPIIFYYLSIPRHEIAGWEKPLLVFIFILGIVLTISGTYSNMKDIVDSWSTYGAPWSCIHLEEV
jgi:amino acid permease